MDSLQVSITPTDSQKMLMEKVINERGVTTRGTTGVSVCPIRVLHCRTCLEPNVLSLYGSLQNQTNAALSVMQRVAPVPVSDGVTFPSWPAPKTPQSVVQTGDS